MTYLEYVICGACERAGEVSENHEHAWQNCLARELASGEVVLSCPKCKQDLAVVTPSEGEKP